MLEHVVLRDEQNSPKIEDLFRVIWIENGVIHMERVTKTEIVKAWTKEKS